jgi:transcriptional regulator with XRE-family HTH domain
MARVIRLRIDELMKSKGLNQKEFAAMTKLRPQTVSELVRGVRVQVDLRTLQKIAEAFEIDDPRELIIIKTSND